MTTTETTRDRDTRYLIQALQQIASMADEAEAIIRDLKGEFRDVARLLPCDQPAEDFDDRLLAGLAAKLKKAMGEAEANYDTAHDLVRFADRTRHRLKYAKETLDGLRLAKGAPSA